MIIAVDRFSVRRNRIALRAEDAQSPAAGLIQNAVADAPVEGVAMHDDVVLILKDAAAVNVDRDRGCARTAAVDAGEKSRDQDVADEDFVGARNVNAGVDSAVKTADRQITDRDVGRLRVEPDG